MLDEERGRRAVDISISLLALVIFGPLLALVAVLIKLESPGPVLFRQKRVGKGEKLFDVYKFRSMTVAGDDEERIQDSIEDIEAFQFKPRGRKTAIGRAIRAASLDELANFLNVLRGDMHIVGPRPDEPEIVAQYRPEWRRRHDVAPGMTGLAQIHGRADLPYAETMAYDLEYVDTRSLAGDMKIMLRTLGVVASREGAR
ncbi:MAG TPA: sugar transferase [Dehalococcoidia bacterium]|nr:sugar transferase [Dehalococcoidia bacterium]